jgi:hypothetical protein
MPASVYSRASAASVFGSAAPGGSAAPHLRPFSPIGKDLHPLSAAVQAMRETEQPALYPEGLGPFLVGRAAWQSAIPG